MKRKNYLKVLGIAMAMSMVVGGKSVSVRAERCVRSFSGTGEDAERGALSRGAARRRGRRTAAGPVDRTLRGKRG